MQKNIQLYIAFYNDKYFLIQFAKVVETNINIELVVEVVKQDAMLYIRSEVCKLLQEAESLEIKYKTKLIKVAVLAKSKMYK